METTLVPAASQGWFDSLSVEVIGGVIAGVLLTVMGLVTLAIWRRRRRPLDWAAAGKKALANRSRRIERARHDELVRHVLDRAETLKIEVPVHVTGLNPAIVTLHPSGSKHARYPDLPSYKAAVNRGDANPMRASFGKTPLVVSRWTDERLREWLREHADDLPPTVSLAA